MPVLGTDYKVKIIYKNIKVAELDVEDKIIKISLPNKYKKANNERILDIAYEYNSFIQFKNFDNINKKVRWYK